MYSTNRAVAIMMTAIGVQVMIAGIAFASELTSGRVEELQVILSYLGMLTIGILGTCFGFVRWFLKRWNPKQLDPETLILATRLQNDSNLGPILARLEDQDKSIKNIADTVGTLLSKETVKPEWER